MHNHSDAAKELLRVPIRSGLEGALEYLSWVAYPSADEMQDRDDWQRAVIASVCKMYGRHTPSWARGFKKERVFQKVEMGIHRICSRRVPAALIASERIAGESFASAIKKVLPNSTDGAIASAIKRDVWQESKPALAMTQALIGELLPFPKVPHNNVVRSLVWSGDSSWLPLTIELARIFAHNLVKCDFRLPQLLLPVRV